MVSGAPDPTVLCPGLPAARVDLRDSSTRAGVRVAARELRAGALAGVVRRIEEPDDDPDAAEARRA
jgi:hypothetical protein